MENWNQLLTCVAPMGNIEDEYRYSQKIAFLSSKGNIYNATIKNALNKSHIDEIQLLEILKSNNDTEIKQIVCKWLNGGFDLPSYAFRELLVELNSNNINATMLVQGSDTLIEKNIGQTMR